MNVKKNCHYTKVLNIMIGINTYRCTHRLNNDDKTYNNYIIHNVNDCLKSKENQLGSWMNKKVYGKCDMGNGNQFGRSSV